MNSIANGWRNPGGFQIAQANPDVRPMGYQPGPVGTMQGMQLPPPTNVRLWKAYWCEFLGSFLFVFVTLGVVTFTGGTLAFGATPSNLTLNALAAGFAYFVFYQMFASYSGAHFNYMITIAVFVKQWFTNDRPIQWYMLAYVFFQYAGAIGGAALVLALFGAGGSDLPAILAPPGDPTLPGLGVPVVPVAVSTGRAVLAELSFASILAIVYLWTNEQEDEKRHDRERQYLPQWGRGIVLGAAVALLVLFGTPLTGGYTNPTRFLGAFTLVQRAERWGILTFVSFIGSVIAALLCAIPVWIHYYSEKSAYGNASAPMTQVPFTGASAPMVQVPFGGASAPFQTPPVSQQPSVGMATQAYYRT